MKAFLGIGKGFLGFGFTVFYRRVSESPLPRLGTKTCQFGSTNFAFCTKLVGGSTKAAAG